MGTIEQCLVMWLLAGIFLVAYHRIDGISVGIPLAYFLGLALIHVPGAALYLDSQYALFDPEIIEVGFQLTTLGVAGFIVGVIVGGLRTPRLRRRIKSASNSKIPFKTAVELNQLAWFLLGVGFAMQLVIVPLLRGIPLTALLSGLAQLTVAGACLGLYSAQMTGDKSILVRWFYVAAAFPVITIMSSAFIGYGVYSLLMVISFATTLFRPRLWGVVGFVIAIYAGLSVYVTYMRDRSEFREAVWLEEAALSVRAEHLVNTFLKFEPFNLDNDLHLHAVDNRLNQNMLVGSGEAHIYSGRAPFANGETMWAALVAPIPRLVWPGKPEFAGSSDIVASYTGQVFADGTSVGVGQVLEFFINFGWAGVFWCYVVLGAICRRLDLHAGLALRSGNFKLFLLFFLPALGLLQQGGMIAEVMASATGAIFSAILAILVAERFLVRIRIRAAQLSTRRSG